MTPSKSKKALPSSTSMAFPEQPISYEQWKAALMQVKTLYLKNQWKQCSTRCSQLLLEAKTPPYPLHATYLHFYSALSSEAIGRSMHNLSTGKLSTLEQAKRSYQAAAKALSAYEPVIDAQEPQYSDTSSESSSSTATDTSSRPTTPTPSQPESITCSSPSSIASRDEIPQKLLSPYPPLRIHKALPPTTHHTTFTTLLTTHLTTLTQTIQTIQTQRHHPTTSYHEDEEAKAADRKARIVRGRRSGWQRERFRPERYWRVCERALGEL